MASRTSEPFKKKKKKRLPCVERKTNPKETTLYGVGLGEGRQRVKM